MGPPRLVRLGIRSETVGPSYENVLSCLQKDGAMSKRIGRPPRRDDPQRIQIVLPGKLRQWLRVRAAREAKDQGDVITEALELYRKRIREKSAKRKPK